MNANNLCCQHIANHIFNAGSPIGFDGGQVLFSFQRGERKTIAFLSFCPFCGANISIRDEGVSINDNKACGLQELTERLSKITNVSEVLSKLGPPSVKIPRENAICEELHYHEITSDLDLVVLVRKDGIVEFVASPVDEKTSGRN